MKKDLEELAKYYFKGGAALFQTIIGKIEIYIAKPELKNKETESYELFSYIEKHYKKIPFEQLHSREEFYPLFVVDKYLPNFKKEMFELFKDPQEEKLETLEYKAKTICEIGLLYRNSIREKLIQIRQTPELKDYKLKIVDWQNNIWEQESI